MAIFKADIQDQYVKIPNETAQDASLSFEARGLLALMLSLPLDWEIHKSWLMDQSPKCGRDRLNNILGELIDAGYVRKSQNRKLGKFSHNDLLVYPTTVDWNSVDGKTVDGKTAPTKETTIQKKQNNKDKQSKASPVPFDQIINIYNEVITHPFKKVSKATDRRKKLLRKFYSEVDSDLDKVRGYFECFNETAPQWMRGSNGYRPFTFEKIIDVERVVQFREDYYE